MSNPLARLVIVAMLAATVTLLAFASHRDKVCEWNSAAQPDFNCATEHDI